MVATLSLSFLSSCSKENDKDNNSKSFYYKVSSRIPYNKITVIDKGFSGRNGSNLMLSFADMNTCNFVLDELDRQVREYDSVFLSQFDSLNNIEVINNVAEEVNYDENQPLYEFADFYTMYSLLKNIQEQEDIFLQQDEQNIEDDPDNHFIVENQVRAILNSDCEVKIADTIYKLTENGYYAIPNGNLKSLKNLSDNIDDNGKTVYLPNVIFCGDNDDIRASDCRSNKRNYGYKKSSDGNYRIKWVVSHWTHPWERRVIAKIDNYKKRKPSSNRWKKVKANSFCKVYGYVSAVSSNGEANCSTQFNFNPSNLGLNSNGPVKSHEHKIIVQTKTTSTWVKGNFYGVAGIEHDQTLTW